MPKTKQDLELLAEWEDRAEVPHKNLSKGFWQEAMDNLELATLAVAFVVSSSNADRTMLDEDVALPTVRCVGRTNAQDLGRPRRLPSEEVDPNQKELSYAIDLAHVLGSSGGIEHRLVQRAWRDPQRFQLGVVDDALYDPVLACINPLLVPWLRKKGVPNVLGARVVHHPVPWNGWEGRWWCWVCVVRAQSVEKQELCHRTTQLVHNAIQHLGKRFGAERDVLILDRSARPRDFASHSSGESDPEAVRSAVEDPVHGSRAPVCMHDSGKSMDLLSYDGKQPFAAVAVRNLVAGLVDNKHPGDLDDGRVMPGVVVRRDPATISSNPDDGKGREEDAIVRRPGEAVVKKRD